MYSEIHVNSSKQVSVLGSTAIQTTAKFCFKCGNNLSSTEVQDTMQQRPKCVRGQKELRMSGQPFCDECGAHQQGGGIQMVQARRHRCHVSYSMHVLYAIS